MFLKLTVFATLLLCLSLRAESQTLTPPVDSACTSCSCDCPEPDCEGGGTEDCVQSKNGGFATATGNPTVAGCGCDCDGCPSCKQAANVVFDEQCRANLVMILDESGSIGPHRTTVRNAVISFLSSFSTINQIGGTATLGLVEFAGSARLVNPECALNDPAPCDPANLPGDRCRGRMCTLETDWINAVTNYMLAQGGNDNDEKYATGGCTNWGDALYQTTINNWRNNAGDAVKPDVVLFFTDGQPTVHTGMGKCNTNCNQNRDRVGTANMKVGRCFGNHVGVGCYWSDMLKENGVKVFLVGVGGINSHIPFTEIITGPNAWDQQVDSFGRSDYVLNADFGALGAIFYNVAKGLCQCLQDQTVCSEPDQAGSTINNQNYKPCLEASNFDARVRVTTPAVSQGFSGNSVYEGFLYYDFRAAPARFAIDYMDGTNLERTDIVNPCQVQRKITCGGSCFSTADTAFIPRFFAENGDTQVGTAGAGFAPTDATCSGGQVLQKQITVQNQDAQIAFLWFRNGAPKELCAARAVDGTLYEFWTSNDKATTGVNNRAPAGKPQRLREGSAEAFNFEALQSCSSPTCTAEVEVLFVIDSNTDATDFFNAKEYVKNIASSYDDGNNRISMGAWFKDPALRVPSGTGLQNQVVVFGNQVLGVPQPLADKASDFGAMINAAVDSFWPTAPAPGSPPRYLITLVGSADTGDFATNQAKKDAFAQKRVDRAIVQAWATGYGLGAQQLGLLTALSDTDQNPAVLGPASYTHYTALGTSSLLRTQSVDQSSRMCPRADLCGGTCQGYCLCGVCKCPPTCSTPVDKCQKSSCPTPSSGCTIVDMRGQLIVNGGCLPDAATRKNCTIYGCDDQTGTCMAAVDCPASCNCSSAGPCAYNNIVGGCNGAATVCAPVPITCSADLCGQQCNPATGLCNGIGSKACDDNNGCTNDTCVVKIIGGVQQGVCQSTDDTENLCPPSTPCAVSSCQSTGADARVCSEQNITSLFDLCGQCLGDFSDCFFSSITSPAGGIAGGVIAGIVVAGILAALLIAFFAKKGYSAYMASSAMGSGAAQSNPAFDGGGAMSGYTKF